MRVFLSSVYRLTSKEKVGDVVARVVAALEAAGDEPTPRFHVADSPVGGQISGVARLLKKHPELAPLEVVRPTPGISTPPATALTNLGPEWGFSHAEGRALEVPLATVTEIAAGIPRSLPLNSATFVWPGLSALSVAGPGTPLAFGRVVEPSFGLGYLAPAIIFTSRWWISGRLNGLVAYIEVPADTRSTKVVLPERTAALLAALGKAKSALIPVPEAPEAAAAQEHVGSLRAVVAEWRRSLPDRLAAFAFPHDLPTAAELGFRGASSGPLKKFTVDAFAPLGYRAATGGRGFHKVERTTEAGTTLTVTVDVGTWSHLCSVSFALARFGTSATLPVPISPRDLAVRQYPITSAEQFRTLVENAAAVVRLYEAEFVPQVESLGTL